MSSFLYLMRHGQTTLNLAGILQGRIDAPLTLLGYKQADWFASYVKDACLVFDHAYCSTLKRSEATLKRIVHGSYTCLDELVEWSFGKLEGQPQTLLPSKPYEDYFVQYGGESEQTVRLRMTQAILTIMQKEDHHCVLIVTHGMAIEQFQIAHAINQQFPLNTRIKHGEVLVYIYEDGLFSLIDVISPDIN